jgi:hypothetical protein
MEKIKVDKNVIIELTPQQLSIIMSHLGKGVYENVSGVISHIQNQVVQQIGNGKVIITDVKTEVT